MALHLLERGPDGFHQFTVFGTHDLEIRLELIMDKVVVFFHKVDLAHVDLFLDEREHPLYRSFGAGGNMHGAQRLTDFDLTSVAGRPAKLDDVDHEAHFCFQGFVYELGIGLRIIAQMHTFASSQIEVDLLCQIGSEGSDQLGHTEQHLMEGAVGFHLVRGEFHSPKTTSAASHIPV